MTFIGCPTVGYRPKLWTKHLVSLNKTGASEAPMATMIDKVRISIDPFSGFFFKVRRIIPLARNFALNPSREYTISVSRNDDPSTGANSLILVGVHRPASRQLVEKILDRARVKLGGPEFSQFFNGLSGVDRGSVPR